MKLFNSKNIFLNTSLHSIFRMSSNNSFTKVADAVFLTALIFLPVSIPGAVMKPDSDGLIFKKEAVNFLCLDTNSRELFNVLASRPVNVLQFIATAKHDGGIIQFPLFCHLVTIFHWSFFFVLTYSRKPPLLFITSLKSLSCTLCRLKVRS